MIGKRTSLVLLASCSLSPNLLFADNVEPDPVGVSWREEEQVCLGTRKDENAESWCTSIECSGPRLPVRTLRGRGGAPFWLAQDLFGAAGGMGMIGARVLVVNEGGSFTTVVWAESLRGVELTAKARYPESAVRIAFPLEPEWFFAGGPHTGAHTGLQTTEGLTDPIKLS